LSASHSSASTNQFPEGTGWLFGFQSFNAINFTIAMGSPMILLIRYLGGSELHVGIVVGLPALMTVLQLVSTRLVERLGYRGSMMVGWTLRSVLLIFIAPLPLLVGYYSPEVLLWILIAVQLGFNIIRGLTSGAWFPWLSQLFHEKIRGKFVGTEQRIINFSAFATLMLSGYVLQGDNVEGWKYSLIIVLATIIGISSAFFLKKSPDRPVPPVATERKKKGLKHILHVAKESWQFTPYKLTMCYFILVNLAVFPAQGFMILYINENLGYTTGMTLKLQSLNTLGVLLTSVLWGAVCDYYGSKPVLKIVMTGVLIQYIFWLLFSVGVITPTWWMIMTLQLVWGILLSGHVIATVKMMLGNCPKKDLTMEMAILQVSLAVCAGTAPLYIGAFLQWLRPETGEQISAVSPGFTTLFIICIITCAAALVQITRLIEPDAKSTRSLLAYAILDWPTRVFRPRKEKQRQSNA